MIARKLSILLVCLAVGDAAGDPKCATGKFVEQFVKTTADSGVACVASERGRDRSCWRVDAKGAVSALPDKQWPAANPSRMAKGDRVEPVAVDQVPVRVPAGMTVKIVNEYDKPATVDVCEGASCKHVVLRAQAKERTSLQAVYSVTVLSDKRTMYVGLGLGTTAAEALEKYDLDKPKQAPQKMSYSGTNGCAEILDVIGGNLLVQTTDCANAGGTRLLVTPAGKQLAKLGEYSSDAPFFALGGDRYLFLPFGHAEIWDAAKAKRIAKQPGEDNDMGAVAVLGDRIVAVESEAIVVYDTALKATKLPGVPRCK
jgi:hypothetical protein